MRDYARISPQFWSGDTGRRLRGDPDALTLAFYLMTCPSSTMSGLFYLPLPTIAHETGLSAESTKRALDRLEVEKFAFYDEDAEHVWVPEMARCQVGATLATGDNRIKGLLREIERSRRSRYYVSFFQRYGSAYHLPSLSLPFERPSNDGRSGPQAPSKRLQSTQVEHEEAPSKGLGSSAAGSTKPLRSQDQDQEKDQDQEQGQESVAPASPSRPPTGELAESATDNIDVPQPLRLESPAGDEVVSKPDEAVRILAAASHGRFVVSRLKRGQAIHTQKLIAAHPNAGEWKVVGEWLAAGGEAWRSEVDARSLGDFEAWLAHASHWRDAGRPALHGRGARAPTAMGYAAATTAYERSEDLTDEL